MYMGIQRPYANMISLKTCVSLFTLIFQIGDTMIRDREYERTDELIIEDSPEYMREKQGIGYMQKIRSIINDDYIIEEDDSSIWIIDEEECGCELVSINPSDGNNVASIHVYYHETDKAMVLAKKLAKKLEIKKIIRDIL